MHALEDLLHVTRILKAIRDWRFNIEVLVPEAPRSPHMLLCIRILTKLPMHRRNNRRGWRNVRLRSWRLRFVWRTRSRKVIERRCPSRRNLRLAWRCSLRTLRLMAWIDKAWTHWRSPRHLEEHKDRRLEEPRGLSNLMLIWLRMETLRDPSDCSSRGLFLMTSLLAS